MNQVLETIKSRLTFVEILRYQEKPVTVVTIVAREGDRFYTGTGKVACMGTDTWDSHFGYKVAMGKAVKDVCLNYLVRDVRDAFDKSRGDTSNILGVALFDRSNVGSNSKPTSRNNGDGSAGKSAEGRRVCCSS